MTIIKRDQGKISTWDGGTTRELFIYPEKSSLENRNFIFRISSAIISNKHSIFTNFNGFKRYIIPLSADLQIKHENESYFTLKNNSLYCFDGSKKTQSVHTKEELIDFNIIINKNYKSDTIITKDINLISYLENHIILIYMLNANCMFNNIKLQKGELLIIEKEESIDFTSDGGDIVIAKIKLA